MFRRVGLQIKPARTLTIPAFALNETNIFQNRSNSYFLIRTNNSIRLGDHFKMHHLFDGLKSPF